MPKGGPHLSKCGLQLCDGMNLTSMVHANFTWRPVPSERLQKTMKLAFLQFIDDDCCVLPGMLAGVVGIHAKPKKDCHSSGHPHHATV